MSKFKVGDYVRVKKFNKRPDGWNKKGEMDYLIGKAVKIDGICSGGKLLLITDKVRGLSCFLEPEEIESINETIVIYRKENQVIALDKVSGSKAIARCHPDDEFDFYIGAKLAFERLMDVSKKEPKKEIQDFEKAMYEIRSNLEKAGFTKQESMDFVIKLSLKGLYPN